MTNAKRPPPMSDQSCVSMTFFFIINIPTILIKYNSIDWCEEDEPKLYITYPPPSNHDAPFSMVIDLVT